MFRIGPRREPTHTTGTVQRPAECHPPPRSLDQRSRFRVVNLGDSERSTPGALEVEVSGKAIAWTNLLIDRDKSRSAASSDMASARLNSLQASTASALVARACDPLLVSGRLVHSRLSSRALIRHRGSQLRLRPRVAWRVASASTPQSHNFSAKVSRQRCKSALRGFSRFPCLDSARTLMCTCGLAWWSCSTITYL